MKQYLLIIFQDNKVLFMKFDKSETFNPEEAHIFKTKKESDEHCVLTPFHTHSVDNYLIDCYKDAFKVASSYERPYISMIIFKNLTLFSSSN